jgi:hypothetical protein
LAIALESLASPSLQFAAYLAALTVAAALERSATIVAIVASIAIAGDEVEGAVTMF